MQNNGHPQVRCTAQYVQSPQSRNTSQNGFMAFPYRASPYVECGTSLLERRDTRFWAFFLSIFLRKRRSQTSDRRRAWLGARLKARGAAGLSCTDARIALWARSCGAALYFLGIYTQVPRWRLSSVGASERISRICVFLACFLLASHRLVRGYVSACPDGHRPSRVSVVFRGAAFYLFYHSRLG